MGSLFLVQVAWAVEAVKIWLEQTVSKKVFLSQPTYITNKYTKQSNKNELTKMVGTYPPPLQRCLVSCSLHVHHCCLKTKASILNPSILMIYLQIKIHTYLFCVGMAIPRWISFHGDSKRSWKMTFCFVFWLLGFSKKKSYEVSFISALLKKALSKLICTRLYACRIIKQ